MRLFIAIQLSDEMKTAVQDVQDTFRWQHVRGNYTPKENLHITLAFIGEYGDPDEVLEALEGVSFPAFSFTMDKVACFDDLWWTGLAESEQLQALARKVRHALAEAGIPFDRKKFRPHITFLRRAEYANGRKIVHMSIEPLTMKVDRISLMRSTFGKNGMIYTELGSVAAQ